MSELTSSSTRTSLTAGHFLFLWFGVALCLNGWFWLNGERGQYLAIAVDRGAARTELSLRGEMSDQDALEAIAYQTDSLTFWAVLALVNDLLLEPSWLIARALLSAILVASTAAITGRKIQFASTLFWFSALQGLWLLGPTTSLLLEELGGQAADSSLRVLLGPGEYPGALWVFMSEVDLIGLVGWCAMIFMVSRRKLGPLWLVVPGLGCLAVFEWSMRTAVDLFLEAGMRLTLMPMGAMSG